MKCLHGNRHNDVTSDNAAQDTGGRFSNQLIGLVECLTNRINPECAWLSVSVNAQIAVKRANENGMLIITCVMTRAADYSP